MLNIRTTHFAAIAAAASLFCLSPWGHAAPATTPYHLVDTIHLPGVEGWDYLTVDAPGQRLYVTRQNHVVAIDIDTDKIAGDIPGESGVHGVAIDDADGLGFITDGKANSVVAFNLKTLAKVRETPAGQHTDGVVYDPYSHRVFAFNGVDRSATVIDAKTGAVAGTIALPGKPEFPATDDAGHVFDNIEDKSEIVEIDANTLKVDAVWPIAPGTSPSGLAIDPKTHRLFSTADNNVLIVMNSNTGQVVGTLAIGSGPDAVVFDPAKKLIFSPAGGDANITVIKEVTPDRYETLGAIATQDGARTIALDPRSHRVYTVTAQRAPSAPGEAPASRHGGRFVDGSFVVLVYAP